MIIDNQVINRVSKLLFYIEHLHNLLPVNSKYLNISLIDKENLMVNPPYFIEKCNITSFYSETSLNNPSEFQTISRRLHGYPTEIMDIMRKGIIHVYSHLPLLTKRANPRKSKTTMS